MKKINTYNIITIGCQMNKSDSERIAGYLEEYDLEAVSDRKKADLVIMNTCGVRQVSEDRIYGLIPKIRKENKNVSIVVTGCLAMREDVQKRLKKYVDIWLPIFELTKLANLLKLSERREAKKDYLKIRPKYESKFSFFVPIGNGCNNFCSYCVVPYARGREIYRPANDIIKEVKELVANGAKEITLIAQNVNSYRCKNINFPKLLKIIDHIKGDFWIRFATSHPKDMSNELIKTIAECTKVCEHIHLPVQSGDDRILKAMNRNYTRGQYKRLIEKIRKNISDVSITTDLIVGFPGETKKEFLNSKKLFAEVGFDMAYPAKYSPRFGTSAFELKDNVSLDEKKIREQEITKVLRRTALSNNKKYINKIFDILISNKGKSGAWFGYTMTNKYVKVDTKGENDLLGKFTKVKITDAHDFGLDGILIK